MPTFYKSIEIDIDVNDYYINMDITDRKEMARLLIEENILTDHFMSKTFDDTHRGYTAELFGKSLRKISSNYSSLDKDFIEEIIILAQSL